MPDTSTSIAPLAQLANDIATEGISSSSISTLAPVSAPDAALVTKFNTAMQTSTPLQPTLDTSQSTLVSPLQQLPQPLQAIPAQGGEVKTMGGAVLDSMQRLSSNFYTSMDKLTYTLQNTKQMPSVIDVVRVTTQWSQFSTQFEVVGKAITKLVADLSELVHVQ